MDDKKSKERKVLSTSTYNQSVIFSTRINGKSTSYSIKYRVIAFYCAVSGYSGDSKANARECFNEFSNTANDIVKDWQGDSAKGLSDFVVHKILESLLPKKQMKNYKKILAGLK